MLFIQWLRNKILRNDHTTAQLMPDLLVYSAVMACGSNDYRTLDIMIAEKIPDCSKHFDNLWDQYQAELTLSNV